MADFNWKNICLKDNLMYIDILDTRFFLSLWEINNPYTLLALDASPQGIKVEAFPGYPKRILSYKECKKGLMLVGFLPAENIGSKAFKNDLKHLISEFFRTHPWVIDIYNYRHPEEKVRLYDN